MTALHRIGICILTAVIVTAILTFFGMGHGKPAAIGLFVGVAVQMRLRAAAKKAGIG